MKSLTSRIFACYVVFIIVCGYFVLHTIQKEIEPGVRQSTEETLVDTANLLAEFLKEPVSNGSIASEQLTALLKKYGMRQPGASIWGVAKSQVNHRIYVTDAHGIVLLDSANTAVGEDYSQWNDVYLTLQGKYGARSTRDNPDDDTSSVMYVGAPIKDVDKIIGVVSVGKPTRTLQPYIDKAEKRLLTAGAFIILLGIAFGWLFSFWLSKELKRLTSYAHQVASGQKVSLAASKVHSNELRKLAGALESMRIELDGKAYIERYIQTLTHELKSPLAGIHAASELLQEPMPREKQIKFISNINSETIRLEHLIGKLLRLSQLEQQQHLENAKDVLINDVADRLIRSYSSRTTLGNISIKKAYLGDLHVKGEVFLLEQCLSNLLDNAIEFTPPYRKIVVTINPDRKCVTVFNEGENIPDYALKRLTERFYSLPRPGTGKKSTGLGLNFVAEIMALHRGDVTVENTSEGVIATLRFHLT